VFEDWPLSSLIHQNVPDPCPRCRRILALLAADGVFRRSCDEMARVAGLRDRHVLAAVLGRHGFPSPKVLRDWMRFLDLLQRWERSGRTTSLQRLAWDGGTDPVTCKRLIRRLVGRTWLSLREVGLKGGLEEFRKQVGERARCGSQDAGDSSGDAAAG
jgi:hypothetical protein